MIRGVEHAVVYLPDRRVHPQEIRKSAWIIMAKSMAKEIRIRRSTNMHPNVAASAVAFDALRQPASLVCTSQVKSFVMKSHVSASGEGRIVGEHEALGFTTWDS